jgi:hypothetical protein
MNPARPGRPATEARLRFASAAVRAWTRFYTWRMPPPLRDARRAEIESDLWEFQQDAAAHASLSPATHVLTRLLAGMPHDLAWRVEHVDARDALPGRIIVLSAAAAAFVVAALWVFPLLQTHTLPKPAPMMTFMKAPPPPPPPPPRPPCRPPAFTAGCRS